MAEPHQTAERSTTASLRGFGLSGKLLLLTILFVMIAEVLIYVPSIANFRVNWLRDRLASAHTAALVLETAPTGAVPESVSRDILMSIGAKAVATKSGTQRQLLATVDTLDMARYEVDVRDISPIEAIIGAFESLFTTNDKDVIRAVGPAPMGGDFVEIVLEAGPLRAAMVRFSRNVLLLSLVISAITAALVFLALHIMIVRPMHRITANMTSFRADPENPARIVPVTGRRDEIGIAERELSSMQRDIATMLHQKTRLAALGLAISKINHDLRNLLGTAQLFSDRLTEIPDPQVQRFAPKVMRALERAIQFCQSTLSYGGVQEPDPDRKLVPLEPLIDEVRETLGILPETNIAWVSAVERGVIVDADRDQLLRVLLNLTRNAMQALTRRAPNDPSRDQIRITGRREGTVVCIEVSDTGPGLPKRTREHLFEAFQSASPGGTGLGLVIADELVRAHGGDIRLVEGTIGATFRITIPDRTVDLAARWGERARA